MDFVRIGSVVVHARRDGDPNAPALVLANPLGADLRLWERVVAYLEERYFVVRFDQRGHGLSTLGTGVPDLACFADDLAGLLDQLDTGPSILCGLGMGGLTALMVGHRRPELVSGLCLMSAAPLPGGPAEAHAREGRLDEDGLAAVADDVLRHWFPEPFVAQRADEVRGWREMLLRTEQAAYRNALHAIAHADVEDAARSVSVPTLAMIGAAEPPGRHRAARALAVALGCEDVHEIDGAAHFAPVTHAGPVAAALSAFVERTHHA